MKPVWIAFLSGALSVLMLAFLPPIVTLPALFIALGALSFLVYTLEAHRKQVLELHRLRSAYEQLDQQAKIIIKTDLELHHTQEQLDRRLNSLMSLHKLSRSLEVGMASDEIYTKLDSEIMLNFGFSKGLLGVIPSPGAIEWRSIVGVSPMLQQQLSHTLVQSEVLKDLLQTGEPWIIHTSQAREDREKQLLHYLETPLIALCPIRAQTGGEGVLLLARNGSVVDIQADKELIAILGKYFEMTIENAALFEEAWQGKQLLEKKVRERTQELDDVNKTLIELNSAKTNFVSAVSHELRTPLAAIKGYASLLVSGQFGEVPEKQLTRLQKIEKHADLLTQLINNLLDIARIESGRQTMEMSEFSPSEFFALVQEMVRPQMDAKAIKYEVTYDGVPNLYGDPQQLQRVLMNLLSNAVKYTPEDGTIRVGARVEDGSVRIDVADSGCGISEDDLPRLFEEFFRSSDPINQTIKGTGLGLSLVKRIVEAHRGRIWVTSKRNLGTTFHIQLPLAPETANARAAEHSDH